MFAAIPMLEATTNTVAVMFSDNKIGAASAARALHMLLLQSHLNELPMAHLSVIHIEIAAVQD